MRSDFGKDVCGRATKGRREDNTTWERGAVLGDRRPRTVENGTRSALVRELRGVLKMSSGEVEDIETVEKSVD